MESFQHTTQIDYDRILNIKHTAYPNQNEQIWPIRLIGGDDCIHSSSLGTIAVAYYSESAGETGALKQFLEDTCDPHCFHGEYILDLFIPV